MTDNMRGDFNLMKEIANHTKKKPSQRYNIKLQHIQHFNKKLAEKHPEFSLKIADTPLEVNGYRFGELVKSLENPNK